MATIPRYCKILSNRNNNITTGYENFSIKKGTVKLFPLKDFDFIGKHVVCQKCCQTFASKMSFRAHVGTSVCVRNYNGPNLVYLNYKNRSFRRIRKKREKLVEDLPHDMKKNLLNPEMLNTLQTRNNCYSDIVHQRNKVKEKQRNGFYKTDDSSEKKPRGRPKKTINLKPKKPKKRGRPKKLNNSIQKDNNVESNETQSKESSSVSICSTDDAYNNNINETSHIKELFSRLKFMVEQSWKLVNTEWNQTKDTNGHQCPDKHNDQLLRNTEDKEAILSKREKNKLRIIELVKIDLRSMAKKIQEINELSLKKEFKDDLELLLSKLNEKQTEYMCRQSKPKNTDMNNEITADEGKENLHCINETDNETDSTDIDSETYSDHELQNVKDSIERYLKHKENILSRLECIIRKKSEDELRVNNSFISKDNSEKSDDITNLSDNHLNDVDERLLICRICNSNFASIAEWKMHNSEHIAKKSNNFLCKICGHRFKMYKNYIKHISDHGVVDQEPKINGDKKYSKKLTCASCGRQYNYLKSYFAHVKTHIK